jgi:hypothetical protein
MERVRGVAVWLVLGAVAGLFVQTQGAYLVPMLGKLVLHTYPVYDVRLGPLQFWASSHTSPNEYSIAGGAGMVVLALLLGGLLAGWRYQHTAH